MAALSMSGSQNIPSGSSYYSPPGSSGSNMNASNGYSLQDSRQTVPHPSGLPLTPPPNVSSLENSGLVFPKMHLGSFSAMDVAYFQPVGLVSTPPPQTDNKDYTRQAQQSQHRTRYQRPTSKTPVDYDRSQFSDSGQHYNPSRVEDGSFHLGPSGSDPRLSSSVGGAGGVASRFDERRQSGDDRQAAWDVPRTASPVAPYYPQQQPYMSSPNPSTSQPPLDPRRSSMSPRKEAQQLQYQQNQYGSPRHSPQRLPRQGDFGSDPDLAQPQPPSSPRSLASKPPQSNFFVGSFTSGGTDHLSNAQGGSSSSPIPNSPLAYLPPGAASPKYNNNNGGANIPSSSRGSRASQQSSPEMQFTSQQSPRTVRGSAVTDLPSSPSMKNTLSANNTPANNGSSLGYSTQGPISRDSSRTSPTLNGTIEPNPRNSARPMVGRGVYSQYVEGSYAPQQYSPEQQQTASFPLVQMPPANIVPSASPRINQASPYPTFPQQYTPQKQQQPQIQTARPPAQVIMEEVCVECMMRDRDMADVDVTGAGAWERESDAEYRELIRREREEDLSRRSVMTHGSQESSFVGSSSASKTRPPARGGRLTEENLKVWLTMNPKEPQARWQTLEAYIKSQAKLLQAEAQARAQAIRESRIIDSKMRDTYDEYRRSVYDSGVPMESAANGIRIPAARGPSAQWRYSSSPESKARDVTLLENGLVVERVDLKKEEKEEKARVKMEEKIEKQRRRMSVSASGTVPPSQSAPIGANDTSSVYSVPSPGLGDTNASYFPPHNGLPGSPVLSARRMSVASTGQLNPPRPLMGRGPSQASIDITGTGVRRFFGRHFSGASQSSLALSGSMMDMHLGLDQDRNGPQQRHTMYDYSAPPSMAHLPPPEPWLQSGMASEPEAPTTHEATASTRSKKKSHGKLGKIWKLVTGQGKEHEEHHEHNGSRLMRPSQGLEDDLSQPLAPPPPLSMLVRDRSDWTPPRQVSSSPSLPAGAGHPRTASAPAATSMGISPPTAPSSLLPSPTSNRFQWRDSAASEERRTSGLKDDIEVDLDTSEDKDEIARNAMKRASAADSYSPQQSGYLNVPRLPPQSTQNMQTTNIPASQTPRPFSLDKSLPPLPNDITPSAPPNPHQYFPARPNTTYDLSSGLSAPNPSFRHEARPRSYSGSVPLTSRPSWANNPQHTIAGLTGNRGMNSNDLVPPPSIGARYDEFGGSRRSLGKFEDIRMSNATGSDLDLSGSKRATKTKSRFGLSSLFGKKATNSPVAKDTSPNYTNTQFGNAAVQSAGYSMSPWSPQTPSYPSPEDPLHSRSLSHSSFSEAAFGADRSNTSVHPRTSIASSKRLEGLVSQSEDFVAYRYPSATLR